MEAAFAIAERLFNSEYFSRDPNQNLLLSLELEPLMKNTLKFVLVIFGILLVAYGIYSFFSPNIIVEAGPVKVETEGDKTQPLAMVGLGILSILAGAAFNRR